MCVVSLGPLIYLPKVALLRARVPSGVQNPLRGKLHHGRIRDCTGGREFEGDVQSTPQTCIQYLCTQLDQNKNNKMPRSSKAKKMRNAIVNNAIRQTKYNAPNPPRAAWKRGASAAIDAFTHTMAPAADSVYPGAGLLVRTGREMLRDLTGFNERRVKIGGGGTVVTTQSAPVAFPRRPDGTRSRTLGVTRDGHLLIHVHDMMNNSLTTAGTANTYQEASTHVYPVNSALLPSLYPTLEGWERHRVRRLRIHFEHVQGTTAVAVVGLAWQPDADEAAPTSAVLAAGIKNIVEGACYEDFCLDVDPSDLANICGPGLFNDGTASDTSEWKFNSCGQIVVYTDLNSATSQVLGRVWVEAVFELWDQRPASIGSGIVANAERVLKRTPKEQQAAVIADTLAKVQASLESVIPRTNLPRAIPPITQSSVPRPLLLKR